MKKSVALALNIDRFMRRIHTNLHPKASAVDREKVGPFGGMILMTIEELEPVPLLQLAEHLARDKSQMTRAIQTLERKSLVKRNASAEDGRVSLVVLTARGRALVKSFQNVMAEVIEDLLVDLRPAEKEQFAAVLRKILSESAERIAV